MTGTAHPAVPGAYALLIELNRALVFREGLLAGKRLPPGRYVYCGSANGPGGIAARLARHLRRSKTLRWHVDRLTTRGHVLATAALPGGSECGLADRLLALDGVGVPLPGFGSSDCRRCRAHLLSVPADFVLAL
jgi:Uri superfamily endonuclease